MVEHEAALFPSLHSRVTEQNCTERNYKKMPNILVATVINDSQVQLASFSACLCSLISCYLLRPLAINYGLVDKPGGRKLHEDHIPLVGGIAMYMGLIITSVFVARQPILHPSFWCALTLLVGVGLLDSRYDIRASKKMACQALAGVMMVVWGGNLLSSFGNLFGNGNITLGYLAPLITIFCVVGLINAVNMMDGMDGLAAGITLISLLGFALAGKHLSQTHLLAILIIASSVFGFWLLNMRLPTRKKAKVFMGDAGSMMLGFIIAWLAVDLSQGNDNAIRPVTALWLIGLPLMDTVRLILTRTLNGKHPFSADNEHLHHILLRSSGSHSRTVWLMLGLSFAMALVGIACERAQVAESLMFTTFMALFAGYTAITTALRQPYNNGIPDNCRT